MAKKKRKISVRKILQVLLTCIVTVGCIIIMVSASHIEDKQTLKSVAVHIRNDKKYHFIEEKEIRDIAINNRNVDIMHIPIAKLDINTMERVIKADPWVADAQVYVDNERILHLYVVQRVPVARLFQQSSESYYIDTTLSVMPLSRNYVYYTMVVTNVPQLKNDSAEKELKKQVVSLVRTIQADTFWNAQISQIIVDSAGMFELVPVLGDHRILFGNGTRTKEKLENLFAFYKNVLNRIGWDKYQTLDLRFKDQVIASPSLPYKGPVDKAIENMNWIASFAQTAANDSARMENAAAEKGVSSATVVPLAASKKKAAVKNANKPITVKGPAAKAKEMQARLAPKPHVRTKLAIKPGAHAKPIVKTKPKKELKDAPKKKAAEETKHKDKKENNTIKNEKAAPKYVYPANNGH